MNDKMKNSIYRLSSLLSLLEGTDGISINAISELLDVPKKIIYDDIITLKKDSEGKVEICTDDEAYKKDFDMEIDSKDTASSNEFIKKIKSGMYDDICIYSDLFGITERVGLVMSSDELELLQNFIDKDISPHIKRNKTYILKNKAKLFNENSTNKMLFFKESMETGSSIEIEYFSGNSLSRKIIRPVRIINNTDENLLYVFDHKGQFYRFDRIKRYAPSDIKQAISSKIDFEKFDKMWGIDFSGDYTHVKLKIFDEGNVIERVKKDLGEKLSPETFKILDGYAIYEDDVIGVNSFLTWVYGYGSSMVLLSPKELVDRIWESIQTRKEFYE